MEWKLIVEEGRRGFGKPLLKWKGIQSAKLGRDRYVWRFVYVFEGFYLFALKIGNLLDSLPVRCSILCFEFIRTTVQKLCILIFFMILKKRITICFAVLGHCTHPHPTDLLSIVEETLLTSRPYRSSKYRGRNSVGGARRKHWLTCHCSIVPRLFTERCLSPWNASNFIVLAAGRVLHQIDSRTSPNSRLLMLEGKWPIERKQMLVRIDSDTLEERLVQQLALSTLTRSSDNIAQVCASCRRVFFHGTGTQLRL